jgi:hypothetical protein
MYHFTELHTCLEEHRNKTWQKVVFMVADTSTSASTIERLRSQYPNASTKYIKEPSPFGDFYSVFVLKLER